MPYVSNKYPQNTHISYRKLNEFGEVSGITVYVICAPFKELFLHLQLPWHLVDVHTVLNVWVPVPTNP
jgi:hypothetical protein